MRTTKQQDDLATKARAAMADQAAVRILDTMDPKVALATLAKTGGRRSLELRAAILRMSAPTKEAK